MTNNITVTLTPDEARALLAAYGCAMESLCKKESNKIFWRLIKSSSAMAIKVDDVNTGDIEFNLSQKMRVLYSRVVAGFSEEEINQTLINEAKNEKRTEG
jgi:hypothetical protein